MKKCMDVLIDKEKFPISEAAELLEMPITQLYSILGRNQSFGYKGFKITRLKPPEIKRGVQVKCLETNKIFGSMKAASNETGRSFECFRSHLIKDGSYKCNGKTYVAINYTPRKVATTKVRATRLKLDEEIPLNQVANTIESPIPEKVEEKSKSFSSEERAIAALKDLAVEKIHEAAYARVKNVIQALELLTMKEQ